MKKLPHLAAELFQKFAYRRMGHYADFGYLSKPRQFEWMKEVAETTLVCLEALEQELVRKEPKPVPRASYERGMYDGVDLENRRLHAKLELLKTNLTEQLQDFIEQELKDANNQD